MRRIKIKNRINNWDAYGLPIQTKKINLNCLIKSQQHNNPYPAYTPISFVELFTSSHQGPNHTQHYCRYTKVQYSQRCIFYTVCNCKNQHGSHPGACKNAEIP